MATINTNLISPTSTTGVTISGSSGTGTDNLSLIVSGSTMITGDLYVTGTLDANVQDFKVTANTMTFGDAASDTLTFNAATASVTNGLNFDSNTLVIDASNNRVGIGAQFPSSKLHISMLDGHNSADYGLQVVNHDNTNGQGNGVFVRAGSGTSDYPLKINNQAQTKNIFAVRGDGKIAVGGQSPNNTFEVTGTLGASGVATFENNVQIKGTLFGGSPLEVSGGMNVTGSVNITGSINMTGSTGDFILTGSLFQSGSGNTVSFLDKVGIGTINPSAQPAEKNDLVIGDNTGNRGMTIASVNTGVGTIRFAPNTSTNDIEGWIDYSGNTKKMRFGTNGLNTRMTIDSAGAVSASSTLSAVGAITTAGGLSLQSSGITNAGAIAGATTVSGSGAGSFGGLTLHGAANLQSKGITNAGSIAGATNISGSGTLSAVGAITTAGGLSLQSSGITTAGAIAGATTVSGSGAGSFGGLTLHGAANLQSKGITNAGSIAGATTIAASGLANLDGGIEIDNSGNKFTVSTAGAVVAASSISGSNTLSAVGAITTAGGLNLQSSGITNAGDIVMTPSSGDTVTFAAATNGALSITTVDTAAAAANIQITADGTFEVDATTIKFDSTGDIILDADGADIMFRDNGVGFAHFTSTGASDLTGSLYVSGAAIQLTAGEAQSATLNLWADQGDDAADQTSFVVADGGNLTVDCGGNIMLDADGGNIAFQDNGTNLLLISNNSSDVVFQPQVSGKDIIFIEDGGNEVFRVDSSAEAIVRVGGALKLSGSDGITLSASANQEIVMTTAHPYVAGAGLSSAGAINTNITKINGIITTTIQIDIDGLTSANCNAAAKVIGNSSGTNAFITRLTNVTNGIIYKAEVACVETPEGGEPNLDLVASTNTFGPGTLYTNGTHLAVVSGGGDWQTGKWESGQNTPAGNPVFYDGLNNMYLGLAVDQNGDKAEYTAGKFVIKLFGSESF